MRRLLFYFNIPLRARMALLIFTYPLFILFRGRIERRIGKVEDALRKFNAPVGLKSDIIICFLLFASSPDEYFLYGFNQISFKERDTFLTDMYRRMILNAVSGREKFDALYNKFEFYKINKEYFDREVFLFTPDTQYERFNDFCQTHHRVFIKENCGSFGHNARLFDISKEETLHIYNVLKSSNTDFILEVAIKQDPIMSEWNSSSVNTVRVPTFMTSKGFQVAEPFMRTGRAGAIVDNAGAGGILAVIDPIKGEVITDGVDEAGHVYELHPTSNMKYKGWIVPQWDKLLKLCEEAHNKMSGHIYIAYDFALTPTGWVMIEGNWGQFISQIATKKGSKYKFQNLINYD